MPDSVPPIPEEFLAEVWVYVTGELIDKFSIEHGEYLIGRDATCHIVIDADQISRHHARLTFSSYELVIEDLGSSNGVFIDGVQVQLPTRIRLDQEVQIGAARLFIRLREEAARRLASALWDTDLGLGPIRERLEGQKYKVITTINRGGMGVILQARDLRIRRTVAMKVMKTNSQFSRENVLRFMDEAQLTGQLEHPNIVPVYELAIDAEGEMFYTMKFVKGITLDDVLRGIRHGNERMIEKYPLGALLTIFQKVCDAVAFAHSHSVVHRDLKPENIMVGSFGEVLVMDWGLAKNLTSGRREPVPEGTVAEAAAGAAKFDDLRGFETLHGLIVGTPPYISPEQARGELDRIDARSDIYVLGEILYAILTLRAPIEGASVQEVVERILGSQIKPPSSFNVAQKPGRAPAGEPAPEPVVFPHCPGRRIPDGLSAVAMKAMQLDPADRYQTVPDLQADIAAYQGGFAPKAERAGLLKHLLLFAARRRTEVVIFATFAVLFQAVLVWFVISVTREKNIALRSEQAARESEQRLAEAVDELRGTAPTFYKEAVDLVAKRELDDALNKVNYAIRQLPNEASYHLLRANILQSMLRWDEAIDAYEDALARNAKLPAARENLALTRKLVAEVGEERDPETKQLTELHAALVKQKRLAEASLLTEKIGGGRPLAMRALKEAADTDPALSQLRDFLKSGVRGRIRAGSDGAYTVDLRGRPVAEVIAFLKARPIEISALYLDDVSLPDLTPLAGLQLRFLSLSGCGSISDLSPIEGMPLQRLNLARTSVRDLSPLSAMPLHELVLEGCMRVRDVRALAACTKLESLVLPRHVKDVAFLKDLPKLKYLGYKSLTQPAAEFWKDFAQPKKE